MLPGSAVTPFNAYAPDPNLWPPVADLSRLSRYLRGYKLHEGLHKELFEASRDERAHGPYVVCNVARAIARVIADRMVLETPRVTVADDDAVNEGLAAISESSQLGRLLLRSLRGWVYRGDLVYKVMVRKLDQPRGPRTIIGRVAQFFAGTKLGASEVIVQEVLPGHWFPEWDPEDGGKLASARVIWEVPSKRGADGQTTEWFQREEHHTPGLIENRLYILRREQGTLGQRYQRNEIGLKTVERFASVPDKIATGIDEIPLVHVPNNETGEDLPWGKSEFANDPGFETNQQTLNERATDHRHMLRKWADPMIAVDTSYFTDEGTGQKTFDVYGHKALPIEQGENPPRFVSVPLENYPQSDAEADKALQRILWTVGISPESLGISKGGYPESGRAIRLRQADTLNTVARKWVSFAPGLRQTLRLALLMVEAHGGGVETPAAEDLKIEHSYGLVQEERERLEEVALKQQLGFSDEHLVRETYPEWDDDAVQNELQQRRNQRPQFGAFGQSSPRNAEPEIEERAAALEDEG